MTVFFLLVLGVVVVNSGDGESRPTAAAFFSSATATVSYTRGALAHGTLPYGVLFVSIVTSHIGPPRARCGRACPGLLWMEMGGDLGMGRFVLRLLIPTFPHPPSPPRFCEQGRALLTRFVCFLL